MSVLLAHQAVSHPATVVGSALSVTGSKRLRVDLFHAFNEAAANTNPGVFIVETTQDSSGNEWFEALRFKVFSGTPASEVLTATEPAGETTIAVASTTGFAADDVVYFRDATLADSEWARVQEIVTNTSIILVDGLVNEHALTTTTIFGSAQRLTADIDVAGAERLRALYLHEGSTGANVHIKAMAREFD